MVGRREKEELEEGEEGQVEGRRVARPKEEDNKVQCTQTLRAWCNQSSPLITEFVHTSIYSLPLACMVSVCSFVNYYVGWYSIIFCNKINNDWLVTFGSTYRCMSVENKHLNPIITIIALTIHWCIYVLTIAASVSNMCNSLKYRYKR